MSGGAKHVSIARAEILLTMRMVIAKSIGSLMIVQGK
jgi:hypothetical protein